VFLLHKLPLYNSLFIGENTLPYTRINMSCFSKSRSLYLKLTLPARLSNSNEKSPHLEQNLENGGGKLGKWQHYFIPKWKRVKGYVFE
jgi:hypothetical protein